MYESKRYDNDNLYTDNDNTDNDNLYTDNDNVKALRTGHYTKNVSYGGDMLVMAGNLLVVVGNMLVMEGIC